MDFCTLNSRLCILRLGGLEGVRTKCGPSQHAGSGFCPTDAELVATQSKGLRLGTKIHRVSAFQGCRIFGSDFAQDVAPAFSIQKG